MFTFVTSSQVILIVLVHIENICSPGVDQERKLWMLIVSLVGKKKKQTLRYEDQENLSCQTAAKEVPRLHPPFQIRPAFVLDIGTDSKNRPKVLNSHSFSPGCLSVDTAEGL